MRASVPFQYGGHATFPVRYGWLAKGVGVLEAKGAFAPSPETADALGLGSKMVESLAFWLDATGLTLPATSRVSGTTQTHSDKIVARHAPYLELPVTWWFLHLALCRREGTVWSWFFNDSTERIFDRAGCTEAFLEHTRRFAQRPATEQAAGKDVGCLLNAYAARPGVDIVSPDDVGACPFRELGLVVRHEVVGRFERVRAPVALPTEAFLASASLLSRDVGKEALSLRELATLRKGPGRIFCAALPAIEDLVAAAIGSVAGEGARVASLAGERHLFVPDRALEDWLASSYRRIGGGA